MLMEIVVFAIFFFFLLEWFCNSLLFDGFVSFGRATYSYSFRVISVFCFFFWRL